MVISLIFSYSDKFQKSAVSSILIHIPATSAKLPTVQWPFNSSTGNTTQLSQPVSLRGLPSYIQNEQQTLFINPIEIQPAWSSTSKCSQDWHLGLSPHPYELIEKLKRVHVFYGCGSNFTDKYDKSPNNIIIKHVDRRTRRKADIANLLFNVDFTAAYYHLIKSHITKTKILRSVETFM